ncbi:MFS transporter [Gilliamella sp. Imp1-1]|uniref:MFS transporter n=1 Tax=Gilliamella sp. Imp1-1 TaxID=3120248 RepID=UPI000461209A|nr:MFS transporter [Gilliamella apicola]KDN10042.1 putative transcriptional regulator [Gilliamella apicola]
MSKKNLNIPNNKTYTHWSGIFSMTLCVFVLIASEFLPVSLLTPIARDLQITDGQAGQGIAISGILAVLTSLTIHKLTGNLDRKLLLLFLTFLMALSGLVIAIASYYLVYILGRALIGIAIGGFWSMSAATAIRLVPQHQVPKALAIFNAGNALATIIAAPLGSYLGETIGWRGAFICIIPLAIFAFIWQCISLPTMKTYKENQPNKPMLQLLKKPILSIGLLACGLFFMGQFTLFTYVRPFLETVAKVDNFNLSLILLAIGVAGFIGTMVIATFLKTKLYQTLMMISLIMTVIIIGLFLTSSHIWTVATLFSLWGLFATAAPTGWWAWIAQTLPKDAEIGGGLMVAVIQSSIAIGSTIGGLFFDYLGWQSNFVLSGILLIGSVIATPRLHHEVQFVLTP